MRRGGALPAFAYDRPMPSVDAGGTELYYERAGSGEPLLLIQGMSGTHLAWGRPFLSELEASFDCVIFDNRGMGRSGEAELPFGVAEMAGDAAALLDALEIETAHVAGISMGGAIAQELALAHPERIRTLTLGATFCGGPEGRLMSPEDLQMLGAAYASGDPEQVFRAMWEINLSPTFRADDARFAAFREMGSALPAPRPVVMQQMRACAEHDTSGRLGGIELPTLVIHGTADRLIDVSNGKLIARLIPAPIELLEDVGHLFWWEQPERSAELIRQHAGSSLPSTLNT
jgi:pimeloyl-ACP methyl ester carboxylesterase